MPNWNWDKANLGFESHAPAVLENGTVITFTRSWGSPPPLPNSAIWLAKADSWNGTYSIVGDGPALNDGFEDTFMYNDENGNFHALFHSWHDPNVGAHAWSKDGLVWTMSNTTAYTLSITAKDGTVITYARRERPHLVLDDESRPIALLTAVTTKDPSVRDFSFTHVQGVRQA